MLAEAAELGFDYRVSSEVEFFVFEAGGPDQPPARSPVTSTQPLLSTGAGDRAGELCRATTEALAAFGVTIDATHHEVAPGQYELDIAETGALQEAGPVIDPLPTTLGEALEAFDWGPVVRAALGQAIHERLLTAKEHERRAYQHHISAWEVEHYLEGA